MLLSVAIALPTASLAQEPAEITVTHAQGETAVPLNPQTILTFDLAALDILDALGVTVTGIPQATMPDYLSDYASGDYLTIGSLREPDYEIVNMAQPDLIIVAGRSAAVYGDLAAMAPTIDLTVDATDYLNSVTRNVETLAEITGTEEEADRLISALETSIEDLRADAADIGDAMIVMTSGGRVTAYGPGSRFGWVHDDLGVTPTIEDVESATHGEAISFEFILEADPDWLFVVDRDAAIGESGEAARQVLDNELVAQTTAWREGQVVYLDSVAWYIVGGGVTAMQNAVNQIADAVGQTP